MKKIIGILGAILLLGTFGLAYTTAQSGFGDNSQVAGYQVPGARTSGDLDSAQGSELLDVIQTTINRVLGMLSLVALLLCLRGGFQMLTAGGDDSKVKTGTKILKNAALGLVVIGLSWLVVSFVFRIIDRVTTSP